MKRCKQHGVSSKVARKLFSIYDVERKGELRLRDLRLPPVSPKLARPASLPFFERSRTVAAEA